MFQSYLTEREILNYPSPAELKEVVGQIARFIMQRYNRDSNMQVAS